TGWHGGNRGGFPKTAGPAQTILDGKDRQSTVHENLPAAHTFRRPGCLAAEPPAAVNFHNCRDRRGGGNGQKSVQFKLIPVNRAVDEIRFRTVFRIIPSI